MNRLLAGHNVASRVPRLLRGVALPLIILAAAAWPLPAAAWPPPVASANTLCVNQGGTGGCFGTIADALAAAADGDTIRIASGVPYQERLALTKSVSLVGDAPATTIIDGSAGGQVIRITSAITVTLTNLTIRNGLGPPQDPGGGIHNQFGNLTLNNVVVSDNHTTAGNLCCGGSGGGLSSDNGRLTLNDSLVTGNTTGSPNDNPASNGAGGPAGQGGGIYSANTQLVINHSTVRGNFTGNGAFGGAGGGAGGSGGGVATLGGTLRVNASDISENGTGLGGGSTNGPGGWGGTGAGIYAVLSDVTVTDSTIDFNGTGWGGAGTSQGLSGLGAGLFTSDSFMFGGAIVSITTSSLSENQTGRGLTIGTGGDGGALYVGAAVTATLLNTTVAYNSSDKDRIGGGIANAGGVVYLKNSLLAHNTDASGPDALHDCSGAVTSLGYNVMMEPDCTLLPNPTGLISDQLFVRGVIVDPPADNGGPTQTNALPPGSLAIDAADNHACPVTDQRGFARPAFGGAALRCDVGAFELYRFGVNLPLAKR